MPTHIRTVCLEFFGLVGDAVPSIVEIKKYIDETYGVVLAGLEHLDDRYIKAVGYSTKASRTERPKMVLIADIASDNEDLVGKFHHMSLRLPIEDLVKVLWQYLQKQEEVLGRSCTNCCYC